MSHKLCHNSYIALARWLYILPRRVSVVVIWNVNLASMFSSERQTSINIPSWIRTSFDISSQHLSFMPVTACVFLWYSSVAKLYSQRCSIRFWDHALPGAASRAFCFFYCTFSRVAHFFQKKNLRKNTLEVCLQKNAVYNRDVQTFAWRDNLHRNTGWNCSVTL